jgi:ribosomal-protein-alanine N-acetyltransferase
MSEVRIRPARIADASQLGAVGYAAWLKGLGGQVGPEVRRRIGSETFLSFARTHCAQILVAEQNGTIVGFVGTEKADNYITDLWISPGFEGRGLGSALVAAVERLVADRGYGTVEIEVLTANRRALRLYHYLGYETVWQGNREDPTLCVELHKTRLRKEI